MPSRIAGVESPVISVEDLIVAKLLAGRPHDLQDVEAIVTANADLNQEQIRSLLSVLDEALGRSDLFRSFEDLF